LIRHPTVCERIGSHPHLSDNLSTSPGDNEESWWVVDRWIEGRTLAERLGTTAFPQEQLGRLMKEIALGLERLHAAKVVFRELAPSRVIVAQEDGRAVLTDFELAKLLDTARTVSANWPDDPYRAPEVEDGVASERSDLYSWARILLHAAAGEELPAKGQDSDALTRVGLPKAVWRVATDCLSVAPSDRPKGIKQVLKAVEAWASS
jgi:serine/threonine protein kinase